MDKINEVHMVFYIALEMKSQSIPTLPVITAQNCIKTIQNHFCDSLLLNYSPVIFSLDESQLTATRRSEFQWQFIDTLL